MTHCLVICLNLTLARAPLESGARMVPGTQETLDEHLQAEWLFEHRSKSPLKALEAAFFTENTLENPSREGMNYLQAF